MAQFESNTADSVERNNFSLAPEFEPKELSSRKTLAAEIWFPSNSDQKSSGIESFKNIDLLDILPPLSIEEADEFPCLNQIDSQCAEVPDKSALQAHEEDKRAHNYSYVADQSNSSDKAGTARITLEGKSYEVKLLPDGQGTKVYELEADGSKIELTKPAEYEPVEEKVRSLRLKDLLFEYLSKSPHIENF